MRGIEIAKKAIAETAEAGKFLNAETCRLLACGQILLLIDEMDTSAFARVQMQEQALQEVYRHFRQA